LAAQPWDPGHKLVGSFQVDRVIIPLPEGTWIVAGNHIWRNNLNTPSLYILLVQMDEGMVRGAIRGRVSEEYNSNGYVASKDCERRDMHFVQKFANYIAKEQDCYWLDHWQIPLDKPNKSDLQARKYVESQGARFPAVMLAAGYRFADRGRIMEFNYLFNPELAGFPPAMQTTWAKSDWHRDSIETDLDRTMYVQTLIDWAAEAYPTVKAGFKGKKLEIPLPSIGVGMPVSLHYEKKSVEDRLRELKSLQDKGLISDEEASKKRKQILEDL